MIKVLMLDYNGVTGVANGKLLAKNIKEKYDVPNEILPEIMDFSGKEFAEFETGKITIEDYHNFLLKKGGKDFPASVYRECQKDLFVDNPKMVKVLKKLKRKVKLALSQNSSRYDYDIQSKTLESFKIFEEFFYSSDLGCYKENPEYFNQCIKKLGVKPEEILFFEDQPKNVESAKEVGINTHLFTSVKEFKRIVEEKIR
ncbi:MAG: HAD-IA family hydrolase [archaeon]